jgi:DNA-binding NtrC family response regulator
LAVIDDEVEMEFLYQILLETSIESGLIELKFFSDSREFLNWIDHSGAPELILCDINMPHLSGIELAKRLRNQNKNMSIFFISGYDSCDFKEYIKDLNIKKFITKPIDYDSLVNTIHAELGI